MNKSSRELNKCIRSLFDEGVDKFYERVNNGGFVNCFRYNNDESYEYCEEMYDMFKSENGDVMVVCDNGECYDNFVFVKSKFQI